MATYLVLPDDYAGWNPTGRNFALVSGVIGAAGLLAWMSLHHHLGSLRPAAASDQLFLSALVWLGGGAFALLAFAAVGSLQLSLKSRGTVILDPKGITRTVKSRTQFLAWPDILGLVPMPYGGVTLVATPGNAHIVIPRFLDDYRACIAEIKQHGIQTLPASSLRPSRASRWKETLCIGLTVFFFTLATSAHESHLVRIASLVAAVLVAVATLRTNRNHANETVSAWLNRIIFLGMLLYGVGRIALTW